MDLKDKVIVITGPRRIGQAVAMRLADSGAHLVLTFRTSKKECEELCKRIKERNKECKILLVKVDLTNSRDVKKLIAQTMKTFKRIDGLVNMAAVFYKTPLAKISDKDWNIFMDTNLKSTFLCSNLASTEMMKNEGEMKGKIINFADWSALRPYRDHLPYLISKAGVIALTKIMAKELAPSITVNCIAPGPILLPGGMLEEEKQKAVESTLLKRTGTPEEIANAVLFILEGTDFMTGSTLVIDGGKRLGTD